MVGPKISMTGNTDFVCVMIGGRSTSVGDTIGTSFTDGDEVGILSDQRRDCVEQPLGDILRRRWHILKPPVDFGAEVLVQVPMVHRLDQRLDRPKVRTPAD